jgi:septal ring factor EnvC (AmiA/AmiB activator)
MNDEENLSRFENKSSLQGIFTDGDYPSYQSTTKNIKGTLNNNSEIDYHGETLTSFAEYNMDTSQLLGSVDPLAATLDPLKFQEHSQPPQPPYGLRFQGFIKPNLDAKQSSSYAYHKISSNTKQMDRIPSLSQTVKQEEHNELSRRHREYYNRMVENYAESSDILNNVCEQLDGKIVRSAADLEKYCRKVRQLDEMLDQERKKWKQQYEIEAVRSLNPTVRTTRQNKPIVGSPSRTAVNV